MTDLLRDYTDEEARAALPLKWGAVEPGVLPAWVAEMDYAPPAAVTEAVAAAVRRGAIGYPPVGDAGVGAAYAGFAQRHWGWAPPEHATVVVGDAIAGIRVVLDALCPPGPVVVPLPCYPPFRMVVELAGREVVPVEVDPDAEDARLDLGAVRRAFEGGARTLLLCNPHNPLGNVPARAELEELRDLARSWGARVVADEIHAPLTLPGATFTPYLSVDETGILVTSHSKTFGTAGLHTAQVVVLDRGEQAVLRSLPLPANHAYSPLGMVAAVEAWSRCDEWHAALLARLDDQRTVLGELLAAHLPGASMRPLAATYLAWLDLRAYGVEDPAAAGLAHGVRVAPGQEYHPGLPGHVRLNLATSPERLGRVVERLSRALAG